MNGGTAVPSIYRGTAVGRRPSYDALTAWCVDMKRIVAKHRDGYMLSLEVRF